MKLSILRDQRSDASAAPPSPLYVLKFGSSVLRTLDDLPAVAGEIYRQRRAGRHVVAVVSALAGETDRLLDEAARVAGAVACRSIPDLVSLGEERTAALLRLACERIGLPAAICRPESLGLYTEGGAMDGQPVRLDPHGVTQALSETGLVIVPGFVGLGEDGERSLLGRGGSDFSAIFLGGELGAERVRLYKDVDGVFDGDPARCPDARRFTEISWADALVIARPLIQPRSVEYAASRSLAVEVEAIGSAEATLVGPTTSPPRPTPERRPLRIGLAGYGVVGQGLAERLRGDPRFEIAAILVRCPERVRRVPPPRPLTADLGAFVGAGFDVLVDALSCDDTGAALCRTLLSRGIHVVSASKRVISGHHGRLSAAAAAGGGRLCYSAAVGGGAPVLETVSRARAEGAIESVACVVNGTVNFVLDRLSRGHSGETALREAQAAGFAEEDCGADLSGADAAAKLRLIAHHAFGTAPERLDVSSEALDADAIARIAASGERWVQVGRLTRRGDAIEAAVRLQPLAEVEELPATRDEWNGAAIRLADGRRLRCTGRGAGGPATAEAIVADLYDLARDRQAAADRAPEPRTIAS